MISCFTIDSGQAYLGALEVDRDCGDGEQAEEGRALQQRDQHIADCVPNHRRGIRREVILIGRYHHHASMCPADRGARQPGDQRRATEYQCDEEKFCVCSLGLGCPPRIGWRAVEVQQLPLGKIEQREVGGCPDNLTDQAT